LQSHWFINFIHINWIYSQSSGDIFYEDARIGFPIYIGTGYAGQGMCIYDDSTEYEVRIVKWHILYGTGDYDDPIELRDDNNIECYYVFYENFVNK